MITEFLETTSQLRFDPPRVFRRLVNSHMSGLGMWFNFSSY